MAKTNQDWYNGKTPFQHSSELCSRRSHQLISLSGIADGSGKIAKGKITFFCQNCEEEITTTVASYFASKTNTVSAGCRNCKKIHAKKREAEKNANRDKGLKPTRRKARVWTNHSPLKSREALLQHLHAEPNPHNLYVLELIRKEPCKVKQQLSPNNSEKFFRHHIIPCHAGGEERKYNEVLVTEKEHWEVHLLRLEVYQEAKDAVLFCFAWKELPVEFKKRLVQVNVAKHVLRHVLKKYPIED